jgi:hypothetical protein
VTRIAALTLLVGCAEGVFVEVHTDRIPERVDRVELLLTDRRCFLDGQECPYIQGPDFPSAMGEPGDIYVRGLGRSTNQLADGVAVFELPTGDGLLPLGFALARDVQGQIIGAAVMEQQLDLAGGPVIYRVALDPIEPLIARQDPGRAGVAEWKTGLDECIGILPVTPDRGGKPLFIVAKDNPDCDAATPETGTECDPFWYDGFAADFDAAHCVMPSEVIAGGPCLLGHVPTCVENIASPNTPSCIETARDPSAEATCLPFALCSSCEQQDEPCQEQLLAQLTTPRVDCQVPGQIDLESGIAGHCSSNEFELLPDSFTETTRCMDANFITTPAVTFHSEIGRVYVDGVTKFEITSVEADSCVIRMKWEGSLSAANLARTILEVTVETGTATRKLWVPIKFSPTQLCPADVPTCEYVDEVNAPDPILRCTE